MEGGRRVILRRERDVNNAILFTHHGLYSAITFYWLLNSKTVKCENSIEKGVIGGKTTVLSVIGKD